MFSLDFQYGATRQSEAESKVFLINRLSGILPTRPKRRSSIIILRGPALLAMKEKTDAQKKLPRWISGFILFIDDYIGGKINDHAISLSGLTFPQHFLNISKLHCYGLLSGYNITIRQGHFLKSHFARKF